MSERRARSPRWPLSAAVAALVVLATVIAVFSLDSATSPAIGSPPPGSANAPAKAPAPTRASGTNPSGPSPRLDPAPTAVPSRLPAELLDGHGFDDVGVMVVDRARPGVVLAHNAHEQFTSASLVKLLMAFEALAHGEPASDVHTMLATSHDPLAGEYWVRYGGSELVANWAQRLGLQHTTPPERPNMWGDTLTTAADTVAVYEYVLHEAPQRTRDVVLSALRAATPLGHDGFDQYFGIPEAARRQGLSFAVKQGWACCTDDRILHTSGLVGTAGDPDRYLVAVLTRSPLSTGYDTASTNVTAFVGRVLDTAGVDHDSPDPQTTPVRDPDPG